MVLQPCSEYETRISLCSYFGGPYSSNGRSCLRLEPRHTYWRAERERGRERPGPTSEDLRPASSSPFLIMMPTIQVKSHPQKPWDPPTKQFKKQIVWYSVCFKKAACVL